MGVDIVNVKLSWEGQRVRKSKRKVVVEITIASAIEGPGAGDRLMKTDFLTLLAVGLMGLVLITSASMVVVEPVIADDMLASLWDRTRLRWLCGRPRWRVCRVTFV